MSEYVALVEWRRKDAKFVDNRYSRAHEWRFDGGVVVPASSSPHVVPVPYSAAEAVDPEEAFVASLSSCHMLVFLSLAAKAGYMVDQYNDAAVGLMSHNESGKLAMTMVTLRPVVSFSGDVVPDAEEHERLHHRAHEECFIAASVITQVRCEASLVLTETPAR